MKKLIMPVMILALMSIGSAAVAQNKEVAKKSVKTEKKDAAKKAVKPEKMEAEKKVVKTKMETEKKEAATEKKGAAELKKQATAAPAPAAKKVEDKIVKGKKGPEGQPVYEGAQGGKYYINKNGNKTYLKN